MIFTIQPELLIRLVKWVAENAQGLKRPNSAVRLTACRNHVCVKHGRPAAESEAIVLTDGQCTLSCRRLLHALMACRDEVSVTVEADERGLCVGRMRLPVLSYSSWVPALEDFQVFMASEIGSISSTTVARAA